MSETSPATDEGAVTSPEPELLHGCLVSWSRDQRVVHATPSTYLALLKALADDGFVMAVDLCGVDYLEHFGRSLPDGVQAERFEVVVGLLDMQTPARLRVRCQVPESNPVVPTLFNLYPGTEAMERETFDMFGIAFDGHPDLTRILMPEDWIGHPLRKDYEVGRIPVQFKGAHS
jgi:NADH-quinone oxidoreductase subunit C